jgi:hypothetical protein
MSIKMMTHVWEHSKHKGSELLTLLAVADDANDNGSAHPSIKRLAQKTRLTERNVQLVIHKLQRSGELVIDQGIGPHGCNLYTIETPERLPTILLDACGLCGIQPSARRLDQHHVLPRSWGGTDDLSNLAPLCPPCHDIVHTRLGKLRELLGSPSLPSTGQAILDRYGPDFQLFAWVKSFQGDGEKISPVETRGEKISPQPDDAHDEQNQHVVDEGGENFSGGVKSFQGRQGEKFSGQGEKFSGEVKSFQDEQGEKFSGGVKSSALLQPQISPLPSVDPLREDLRENQEVNPILAVPRENGERMTTTQVDFLRAILDGIPAKALETAPTFHDAVYTQLLHAGAEVRREYPVPDRGDGRAGVLDLLVTTPWVIGLELDAVNPRTKSVRKLQFVDGLRVILLRGRGPVVEVPEGIHAIMRHTYSASTPKPRGARVVPDTFVVTDKMRAWAQEKFPSVDIEYETEKMRDFEFKDTKTDWVRTWSRWMRTAWERMGQGTSHRSSATHPLSWAEQRLQREAEAARTFAGVPDERPPGSPTVCGSDDAPIEGVEYHRIEEGTSRRLLDRPQ